MVDHVEQQVVRTAPRYGFGKRLKTASISTLITSLVWIVFMVLYWPRTHDAAVAPAAAQKQAGQPAIPAPTVAASTGADGPATVAAPAFIAPPGGLRLPVQGVTPAQLTDTYGETRGDGTRGHNAVDIMAPRGTPVLAAADGTVEKLFLSKAGGNTAYVRSPDGKAMYYYAHLDGYAPGVIEGMTIKTGQILGSVGSSGDADPGAPHLHFAIMAMAPNEDWWQGRPINPYPLLGGR